MTQQQKLRLNKKYRCQLTNAEKDDKEAKICNGDLAYDKDRIGWVFCYKCHGSTRTSALFLNQEKHQTGQKHAAYESNWYTDLRKYRDRF